MSSVARLFLFIYCSFILFWFLHILPVSLLGAFYLFIYKNLLFIFDGNLLFIYDILLICLYKKKSFKAKL